METRCRSVEKPRVQVIGFNVLSSTIKPAEAAPVASRGSQLDMVSSAATSCNEVPISKPGVSSPRSALQQLLTLNQSLPATATTSPNHSLPPFKPSNQSHTSSGCLKSVVQWEPTASANQSSHTSLLGPIGQSQNAISSAKPSQAARSGKCRRPHIDDNDLSAAKSKKSIWVRDDDGDEDDDPSVAEICSKKSSLQGINQPATEQNWPEKSSRSEEKSTKSSVFLMFMESSPDAPADNYHQGLHSVEHSAFKSTDFLNSCHRCRRSLGPDQDVFMYSGDKAFCSLECRHQQLLIDKSKGQFLPPTIRSIGCLPNVPPHFHRYYGYPLPHYDQQTLQLH